MCLGTAVGSCRRIASGPRIGAPVRRSYGHDALDRGEDEIDGRYDRSSAASWPQLMSNRELAGIAT